MNTYREFTIRQQVIFYAVTLLVASACIYFDFTYEDSESVDSQQIKAIKLDTKKQIFSGNEVAHSTFAFFQIK